MKQLTINKIYKFAETKYQKTMEDKYWSNDFLKTDYLNYDFIHKLEYNDETKKIILIIKNYEKKPKITKYIQRNYVKTPIYGDYSIKIKNIRTIDKKINIAIFLEEELLNYLFSKQINNDIINYFDYVPSWKEKEIDIDSKEKEINDYRIIISNSNNKISNLKKEILLKQVNYNKKVEINNTVQIIKSTPDSNYKKCAYILLSFSGFGLIFWFFYVSKARAQKNKVIKENSTKDLENLLKDRDIKILEINTDIKNTQRDSDKILLVINLKEKELLEIKLKDYKRLSLEPDDEGFLNLKNSFNYSWVDEIKGVYIIWNKTKNKYYVGQSKNIMKRIMNQHFNKGDVKNIIFAKDWFNNDDFYWKYDECQTKDKMDELEKIYIEEYNSFTSGYNSTSGNT